MGKKKQTPEPEIPEHVVTAFQETQKKLEVLQTQLDKLHYRIFQENRKKVTAKLALQFIESPEGANPQNKYYMQVGKAFAMRPFERVKQELKTTTDDVEKELPRLLIAQAQFDIKKKEQLDNLQAISHTARHATGKK